MSRFIRPASAGLALLLTCGVFAVSDSAFAATSHTKTATHKTVTHKTVTHKTAIHKPVDKLAGARKGAAHALAAEVARVNRVAAAEAASTVLSPTDKTALQDAITADLAALAADGTAVTAATTARGIQAAVRAGGRTAQGAQLQFQVVTLAERLQAAAAALTAQATSVSDQAAALAAGGTDVSTVTTPLADLATQVSMAQQEASVTVAGALAFPADPTAELLHAANATARTCLAEVAAALAVGKDDLAAATAALTALQAPPAAPAETP
jgi:hypothetical protein